MISSLFAWFAHLFAPRPPAPALPEEPTPAPPAVAIGPTADPSVAEPPEAPKEPSPAPPVYPPKVVLTTSDILVAGRATLREAIESLSADVVASPDNVDRLLGIAWMESYLGQAGTWAGSNNWGAVVSRTGAPYGGWGVFVHGDHDAHGNPVLYKFQQYPTQLDGARGFLSVILRGKVPAVLSSGSSVDLARAMYANKYFTGVHGPENADANIADYAAMIDNGFRKVRTLIGTTTPAPPSSMGVPPAGTLVLPAILITGHAASFSPALFCVACAVFLYLHTRSIRSLPRLL